MTEHTSNLNIQREIKRRRDILPAWIKIFTWINMVLLPMLFAFTTMMFCRTELNSISLFFDVTTYLDFLAVILSFTLGLSSYALWFEKKWAVDLALFTAQAVIFLSVLRPILKFVNCLFVSDLCVHVPLELLLLVPFYYAMKSIKVDWRALEIKS